ncbi:hypothetical protein FB451DRAFT_588409 [Mycena latifolia]|nr:hypothetical protein FB451DRAFT_588409 [Mycena latifolia]
MSFSLVHVLLTSAGIVWGAKAMRASLMSAAEVRRALRTGSAVSDPSSRSYSDVPMRWRLAGAVGMRTTISATPIHSTHAPQQRRCRPPHYSLATNCPLPLLQ